MCGRKPVAQIDVTPEDLLQSAAILDTVAEDLRHAHNRLHDVRTTMIGAGNVTDALRHFADEWEFGMGRMVESVKFTARALRTAGEGYAEVESKVLRALERFLS
jgi:hypothetical protein